jgi:hypothetical protein
LCKQEVNFREETLKQEKQQLFFQKKEIAASALQLWFLGSTKNISDEQL